MGSKCSKVSKEKVSDNVDSDKLKETLQNQETLTKRDSQKTNQSLEDQLDKFDQILENHDENDLSPIGSKKSLKSNNDLDSGFTPGLLPFDNSSISINEPNTSLTFNKEPSLVQNATMENSRTSSFREYDLTKDDSMSGGVESFPSTDYSDEKEVTVDMRTFTPFDMRKTDELAKFFVSKCGLGLKDGHNSSSCPVCQTVDLSDAPLIA